MKMKMKKNKKKHDDEHMDESWLLPYSDLLTLLVALFIVLFAMSTIDAQKFEEMAAVFRSEFGNGDKGIMEQPIPTPEVKLPDNEENETKKRDKNTDSATEFQNLQKLKEKIDRYIEEHNLNKSLGTELTDQGLMISIENDVSFDPGSAEVSQNGVEIAEEISKLLYTDPPHQITISGHTDDVPMNNAKFRSNWELSVMRAVNFMTLVLENSKLDPTKFSAKGFGEHQPLVPNTSAENRAINRRVEVLILPNYDITEHLP